MSTGIFFHANVSPTTKRASRIVTSGDAPPRPAGRPRRQRTTPRRSAPSRIGAPAIRPSRSRGRPRGRRRRSCWRTSRPPPRTRSRNTTSERVRMIPWPTWSSVNDDDRAEREGRAREPRRPVARSPPPRAAPRGGAAPDPAAPSCGARSLRIRRGEATRRPANTRPAAATAGRWVRVASATLPPTNTPSEDRDRAAHGRDRVRDEEVLAGHEPGHHGAGGGEVESVHRDHRERADVERGAPAWGRASRAAGAPPSRAARRRGSDGAATDR